MDHLSIQEQEEGYEKDLIDVEDTLGVLPDLSFVVDNYMWQSSDIAAGEYFIRQEEIEQFYKELKSYVSKGFPRKRKFKSMLKKFEHLENGNYLLTFIETENLPRQLVNLIDNKLKDQ